MVPVIKSSRFNIVRILNAKMDFIFLRCDPNDYEMIETQIADNETTRSLRSK